MVANIHGESCEMQRAPEIRDDGTTNFTIPKYFCLRRIVGLDRFLVAALLVLVGVSLQTHLASEVDLQIPRKLQGTISTNIFKLLHARWADRQRACLLELVVVHQHEGHAAIATFAGFDAASYSMSVDLQIVT